MKEEIWKQLVYPGLPENNLMVSNMGRLMNSKTGTLYRFYTTVHGYKEVVCTFGSDANRHHVRIHRAVAYTFIPNPNGLREVNHLDGNKINNSVENLEWCSRSDNEKHKYSMGLCDTSKFSGVNNGRHKLDVQKIEFIRKNYKSKNKEFGQKPLAQKFGVSTKTIQNVVYGVFWKNV